MIWEVGGEIPGLLGAIETPGWAMKINMELLNHHFSATYHIIER